MTRTGYNSRMRTQLTIRDRQEKGSSFRKRCSSKHLRPKHCNSWLFKTTRFLQKSHWERSCPQRWMISKSKLIGAPTRKSTQIRTSLQNWSRRVRNWFWKTMKRPNALALKRSLGRSKTPNWLQFCLQYSAKTTSGGSSNKRNLYLRSQKTTWSSCTTESSTPPKGKTLWSTKSRMSSSQCWTWKSSSRALNLPASYCLQPKEKTSRS